MASKRGLGKGLDVMIPTKTISKEKNDYTGNKNVSRETLIKINDIEPNINQPRKRFDEDSLHELAESIKQFGVLQPLLLQKRDKYYEIIAGERRWRAARLAGLKEVPAIVKEYSSQEVVEIALIENIQREDLNPIEEAYAYQRLIKEFELKQDELADRVSKSRTAITNSMRLLNLGEGVQKMLIDDLISSGHARALLPIKDKEEQLVIANRVMDENLSVRETEKLVKKILENKPNKKAEKNVINELIYKDLEEKIKSAVGTKVSIKTGTNNRGKIELEYFSSEELERLVDMFLSISSVR